MKDITLIMLQADTVAKKNFGKKKVVKSNISILIEIYDFFFNYLDMLTLNLPPKEKIKIWNKNITDLCFKTYLHQHHKLMISDVTLEKIHTQLK